MQANKFASTVIPCPAMKDSGIKKEVLSRFINLLPPSKLEKYQISLNTLPNFFFFGVIPKYFVLYSDKYKSFTLYAPVMELGLCLVAFRRFLSDIYNFNNKNNSIIHKRFKLGICSAMHYYEHIYLDKYAQTNLDFQTIWSRCNVCPHSHHPQISDELKTSNKHPEPISQSRCLVMESAVKMFNEAPMTELIELFKDVEVGGYAHVSEINKKMFESTPIERLHHPSASNYTIRLILERYQFLTDQDLVQFESKLRNLFVELQGWLIEIIKKENAYGKPYELYFNYKF